MDIETLRSFLDQPYGTIVAGIALNIGQQARLGDRAGAEARLAMHTRGWPESERQFFAALIGVMLALYSESLTT